MMRTSTNQSARLHQALLDELPEGWARVRLNEVTTVNMGQSPPGRSYNDHGEGLPFFQGKADFGERYPKVRVWCTEPKKIANPGDVLLSVRAPVGPTNVADRKCIIGRGLSGLTPLGGIPTEMILFALRLLEPELSMTGTGSTFTAISKKDIDNIEVSLPPLGEQKRIVAKVEELLARVNGVRDHLANVKEILNRFRQSVLAAACSGRLTPDWRGKNPSVEPASELLTRLCCGNKKRIRFRESEISTWVIVKVEDIFNSHGGGTPSKSNPAYWNGNIPWIASGDVKNDHTEKGSLYITEEGLKNSSARVCLPNSVIVVVRSGILRHTLPVSVVKQPLAINQDIKCFDSKNTQLNWWLFLNIKARQNHILTLNREGTTVQSVRYDTLKHLEISVPPRVEQEEIIRRVEALLRVANQIEAQHHKATIDINKITQSILAKAFRGELVPTEAQLSRREGRSYESASALLAKIERKRGNVKFQGKKAPRGQVRK